MSKGKSSKINSKKRKVTLKKFLLKKNSSFKKIKELIENMSDGRKGTNGSKRRRKAGKNSLKKKKPNF